MLKPCLYSWGKVDLVLLQILMTSGLFPLYITSLANNKNIKCMLVTAKGVCLMLTMCEIALNPKYKYNLLAHVKTSWSAK